LQQQIILTCRSLTYAQMTKRVLEATGITTTILRTPQELTTRGCGYAARIPEKDLNKALAALGKASIKPEKAFRQLGSSFSEVKV